MYTTRGILTSGSMGSLTFLRSTDANVEQVCDFPCSGIPRRSQKCVHKSCHYTARRSGVPDNWKSAKATMKWVRNLGVARGPSQHWEAMPMGWKEVGRCNRRVGPNSRYVPFPHSR